MRFVRWNRDATYILLGLLLVVAVATVLITPDPTDDVHGIVRSHRTLHPTIAGIAVATALTLHPAEQLDGKQSSEFATSSLLQLICTFRC